MNKKELIKLAEEQNVRFVRLQFTDIMGMPKNVSITVDQLEKALDGDLMFDGSSIEGFARIEESDMYLMPDPNTFTIYPWKTTRDGKTARLICDVYDSNKEPFPGCPRVNLKRVVAEAEAAGYQMNVGP